MMSAGIISDNQTMFNEAVDYYEKARTLAESGEGTIEVRVDKITERFAEARPKGAEKVRPDGIGLYSRPRSRKNTVVGHQRGDVWA